MQQYSKRAKMKIWKTLLIASLLMTLAACSTPTKDKPENNQQEDQNKQNESESNTAETYTVKKGDTVFSIMRETGVYWKDIIELNNLKAPRYTITLGQVLRLK